MSLSMREITRISLGYSDNLNCWFWGYKYNINKWNVVLFVGFKKEKFYLFIMELAFLINITYLLQYYFFLSHIFVPIHFVSLVNFFLLMISQVINILFLIFLLNCVSILMKNTLTKHMITNSSITYLAILVQLIMKF